MAEHLQTQRGRGAQSQIVLRCLLHLHHHRQNDAAVTEAFVDQKLEPVVQHLGRCVAERPIGRAAHPPQATLT